MLFLKAAFFSLCHKQVDKDNLSQKQFEMYESSTQ